MRPLVLALALLVAAPMGGCLGMEAAMVPGETLEAKGWVLNETASASDSAWAGIARTEILVYEHPSGGDGYGGVLTLVTQRSYLDPDEETLRDDLEERVRRQAESRGIRIDTDATEGSRENEEGRTTSYFTYNGTAREDGVFTRDAEVRIVGEVWNCRAERTTVVGIGLAQVNDIRVILGNPVPRNPDMRTWADIVADPDGTIQGHTGNGLLHRVACQDP